VVSDQWRAPTFQFLWGWNTYREYLDALAEYDLSIPLRMKRSLPWYFLLSWDNHLSIPLRMKHSFAGRSELEVVEAFNSFEDETTWRWSSTGLGSRYTFNSFEDETMFENMTDEYFPTKGFQFLWGWNWFGEKGNNFQKRLSIPLRMKPQRCGTCRVHCLPHLSIPLRMKPSRRLP